VVRKIADERSQYGDPGSHLSFATVYDEIKRSNSSLSRKNKKLLEDSIERVLETLEQDDKQDSASDSINGEFDGIESVSSKRKSTVSNSLNRSIVGAWANTSHNGSSTPGRGSSAPNQDQEPGRVDEPARKVKRQANGEPLPKKRRAAFGGGVDRSPPTHVNLEDLGGVDHVVEQLRRLVLPMTFPQLYSSSRVQPARGVLIYGPPGCGKTAIANAFAAHLGVSFISISAPSIVSGMSGESEKALREYFEEAKKLAPCLMFIDEIDAITPKRESAQREMEKRIVAQLLTCMDDLILEKTNGKAVIVLAATNRPDSLDPALRRGGRFNKEINMSVPNEASREKILRAMTRQSKVSDDVDYEMLARRTPGFVGADLEDLVLTASEAAMERCLSVLQADADAALPPEEMDIDPGNSASDRPPASSGAVASLDRLIKYTKTTSHLHANPPTIFVSNADFLAALPSIQPSALREGFATIPTTTFADIGALAHHRLSLDTAIINPIANPKAYASLGIAPATGLLLWGPPGCGKTLLAKAVANESKANFISVKGPELLNKYVGESERAVRQVFARARSSVPVVIFFDELDALVPHRADGGSMSEASSRVVNTMLAELDGVGDGRDGIYVIAATNRPHAIDLAMLRPGRLETVLFVGLPDADERVDILRTLVRKLPNFEYTSEIADIARHAEGFSGADLGSLLRKAGDNAVKRAASKIEHPDFVAARNEVRRSVSDDDLKRYEALKTHWADARAL
jgi:ribosome biogenesis ATPase